MPCEGESKQEEEEDEKRKEKQLRKKGADNKGRRKRKGKTPDPHRLSHFVAPLYVAPSPTPGNATPEASFGRPKLFWTSKKIFWGAALLLQPEGT